MQRSDNHEPLTDDNHPRQPAKMIVVTPDILLDAVHHGYRETLDITQTNAVQIVFQIPAALDPADYAKLITKAPHG